MSFELNSELVKLGRLIHNDSYKRSKKEIRIGSISIDYITKEKKHSRR
ncbi:MAG: Dna2/Cas4 domain-containing protein [Nitrosopumilus sp.]|nr:Dna2/Cas4 domain-containing protein [Nitrosopumilus sp.]